MLKPEVVTAQVMKLLGIEMLRIYNYSLIFNDVHHNYHKNDGNGGCVHIDCDCSHACL